MATVIFTSSDSFIESDPHACPRGEVQITGYIEGTYEMLRHRDQTTLQEVRERFADVEDEDERERLMCEALLAPPLPAGCTGAIDEHGRITHDGDTCPIHDVDSHTQGVPAISNGRRRRAYGLMHRDKLLRCIQQLSAGFGDAYDQCIERGHMPNDDLWLARKIAMRKGWLE
jgi:hypothetical protein